MYQAGLPSARFRAGDRSQSCRSRTGSPVSWRCCPGGWRAPSPRATPGACTGLADCGSKHEAGPFSRAASSSDRCCFWLYAANPAWPRRAPDSFAVVPRRSSKPKRWPRPTPALRSHAPFAASGQKSSSARARAPRALGHQLRQRDHDPTRRPRRRTSGPPRRDQQGTPRPSPSLRARHRLLNWRNGAGRPLSCTSTAAVGSPFVP